MLKNYYDIKTSKEDTFKSLYIGKNLTKRAHKYLVLDFDFSGIDTTSFEKFEISLNDQLNTRMKEFRKYYKKELKGNLFEINEEDAIDTFQRLVSSVGLQKRALYILFDEYDASINQALGNIEFIKDLQIKESKEKTIKIESKFKQINIIGGVLLLWLMIGLTSCNSY